MIDGFVYPIGVTNLDSYDLQTYLEGGTEEAMAAARRLDARSVAFGQMSQEVFDRKWRNQE